MQIIIYPPKSPVIIDLFGLNIRFYGLILCCAIIIGAFFAYKLLSKISKEDASFFADYLPPLVIFSIIGARLFYIIGNLEFYLENKKEMFFINHGGLSIWGAILFGIAGLAFYLRRKKRNILLHLDVVSVVMPLCQAIGRFGNYFNQEAFGAPTDFFIKLYVKHAYRPEGYLNFEYFHPTFLYESLLDILIFIILFILFKKNKSLKTGTIFCLYIILYSIVRIIIEHIRIDSIAYVFNIPIASFICLIMLFSSLIILLKIYKKNNSN